MLLPSIKKPVFGINKNETYHPNKSGGLVKSNRFATKVSSIMKFHSTAAIR